MFNKYFYPIIGKDVDEVFMGLMKYFSILLVIQKLF